jgi:acetyl-CoA carboxylase beta subunit
MQAEPSAYEEIALAAMQPVQKLALDHLPDQVETMPNDALCGFVDVIVQMHSAQADKVERLLKMRRTDETVRIAIGNEFYLRQVCEISRDELLRRTTPAGGLN